VPHRVDLRTGAPQAGTYLQEAIPDAVSFKRGLILEDKPLGRPIAKDRQEIIRAIRGYEASQGELPTRIAIPRYDPASEKWGQSTKFTLGKYLGSALQNSDLPSPAAAIVPGKQVGS